MSKPLTIAELARVTDLTPATLRAWERRHGFPRPARAPSGHRRYSPTDVETLRVVNAERRAGATLEAAIAHATAAQSQPVESILGSVRARVRHVETQVVSKRTLVAISHALEDEIVARGERGLLVGAFQEQRHYAQAAARWQDLARTALCAVVFADFGRATRPARGPAKVPIARGSPLEREWAIVYLAPRHSALLLARELPGRARVDGERRFELVWSAQPGVVRAALVASARFADRTAPAVASELAEALETFPRPLGLDADFVTALTNRMIAYLDR